MNVFLYAISFLCIAIGCCTILYTNETRNFLRRLFNKIDRRFLSVFEAILGILLLVSATASHHSWFIRLIGLMAIIEGGAIFLMPKNLYDELINWYVNSLSDQTYRLFGTLSLILGTAMLSWVL
ncbi:MAG: hypothetical protein OET57_05585 [Desulfobacteraceae bacterium]|nr:hypothetical protein [Desulfobacteraceae bacterium]MDH3836212.1 hypothetical protein [Desulfobacteraceae bacterium]